MLGKNHHLFHEELRTIFQLNQKERECNSRTLLSAYQRWQPEKNLFVGSLKRILKQCSIDFGLGATQCNSQLSTLSCNSLSLSLSTLSRNVTLSIPTSNLLSRIHFVAKALNNQTGLYNCSSFYLFSLVLLDDFCETICTREKFDHIGILINIDTIALPKSIKHKSQEN